MVYITTQRFLDDATVAAKIAAGDFAVSVSPSFDFDGRNYSVVLDGHHSLAAASIVGAEPEMTVATPIDHDAVALLLAGDIETFLAAVHSGEGDYIDAMTGALAF